MSKETTWEERFEKLCSHDDYDSNCAAHYEGLYCCLDKEHEMHLKVKAFISQERKLAVEEAIEKTYEEMTKVVYAQNLNITEVFHYQNTLTDTHNKLLHDLKSRIPELEEMIVGEIQKVSEFADSSDTLKNRIITSLKGDKE